MAILAATLATERPTYDWIEATAANGPSTGTSMLAMLRVPRPDLIPVGSSLPIRGWQGRGGQSVTVTGCALQGESGDRGCADVGETDTVRLTLAVRRPASAPLQAGAFSLRVPTGRLSLFALLTRTPSPR